MCHFPLLRQAAADGMIPNEVFEEIERQGYGDDEIVFLDLW